MLNLPINDKDGLKADITEVLKKHGINLKTAKIELHLGEYKVKAVSIADLKIT